MPSLLQYPPNTRRTDGHPVSVEHHERQSPIAFQRVLQMELDDRFFLPRLHPEIAGNPTVVLVDAPIPLPPVTRDLFLGAPTPPSQINRNVAPILALAHYPVQLHRQRHISSVEPNTEVRRKCLEIRKQSLSARNYAASGWK